ncbi:MAG: flagellar assembly protein FliW [bacterium]
MTSLFGNIDIEGFYKIIFTSPILGFEDEREFILIRNSENSPFYWLQSLNTPELAFLLADPFVFFPDYKIPLETEGNIAAYVIVTVEEDFRFSTANLLAPIIIDADTNTAMQIVLEDSGYTTKHRLFNINDPVVAG